MRILAILPYQPKLLKALADAVKLEIGSFILVGDKTKIIESCYRAHIDIGIFVIYHYQLDIDSVDYARDVLRERKVDYLLFGDVPEMYQIKILGANDALSLGNIDIIDLPMLRHFLFLVNHSRHYYVDYVDKKQAVIRANQMMKKLGYKKTNCVLITNPNIKTDVLEANIIKALIMEDNDDIEFNFQDMKSLFSEKSDLNIYNHNINLLIMRNHETSRILVNTISAFLKARIGSLIYTENHLAIDSSLLDDREDIIFSLLILHKLSQANSICLNRKSMV
ncbi:MAG: hypothetical protein GX661_05805 [Acholeplasmataceae bacterium]|nr:hypothetical protein [Acholeplasmataceae bacterium]